ncbi:MAG TPA: sensor histidine kinase [Kofleriaceae bacterium]|nr:sensor histidine kinase [Kofleriaceae bacterium]
MIGGLVTITVAACGAVMLAFGLSPTDPEVWRDVILLGAAAAMTAPRKSAGSAAGIWLENFSRADASALLRTALIRSGEAGRKQASDFAAHRARSPAPTFAHLRPLGAFPTYPGRVQLRSSWPSQSLMASASPPVASIAAQDPGATAVATTAAPARDASPLAEEAVRDLSRTSVPGILFHLAGLVFFEIHMPGADRLPRTPVIAIFVGCLLCRLFGVYLTSRNLGSLRQRMAAIAIGAIGTNVVWGLRTAAVQLHTGTSAQSLTMVVIMAGLSSGAMTAFAPSLWIQRAAQSAMFVPVLVVGAVGLGPGSLAVLHALYFIYILAQGSLASRTYWRSARATESLRRHAEVAQLAAIAADETNLRLRAEIAHNAQMEVELRQAQKLEAIGRLAAGIAHEINTPVQFVGDSCRFLGDGVEQLTGALAEYRRVVTTLADGGLPASDALTELARIDHERDLPYLHDQLPGAGDRALDGLDRVAKIVAATKEFAYPHHTEKALADVNRAIENILIISNNEIKYVAHVETELGALPPILCLLGELNQVILNIIVNAAHAIGDVVKTSGDKGTIHIKTWTDPGWVRIAIRDTGTGIAPEILDKIYEPFFTTKPVGQGTGQGLAIARSAIVDKHGGTIDVQSTVGAGTTFTISLPIT